MLWNLRRQLEKYGQWVATHGPRPTDQRHAELARRPAFSGQRSVAVQEGRPSGTQARHAVITASHRLGAAERLERECAAVVRALRGAISGRRVPAGDNIVPLENRAVAGRQVPTTKLRLLGASISPSVSHKWPTEAGVRGPS